MRVHTSRTFAAPAESDEIHDERLIVHRRSKRARNRHLVVFVHGLGGKRYGHNSTWGTLPQMIYEDFPNLDLGMYSYRTLLRRLVFWKSIPLETEAEVLASEARLQSDYESILLVGHSLGGLLCKGAVCELVNSHGADHSQRISGIVLFATPQLGSLRVPKFLAWLTSDFQCLRAHSTFVSDVERTITTKVNIRVGEVTPAEHDIPIWAIVGSDDWWVDKLSASVGIPSNQRCTVPGTHTAIVKPRSRNDIGYRFLVERIKTDFLGGPIFRFKGHDTRPPRNDELITIYNLAQAQFGSEVSSLAQLSAWRSRNPDVVWLVQRVERAGVAEHRKPVGYFCAIPMTAEGYQGMLNGSITGPSYPTAQIEANSSDAGYFYIGAVLGTDRAGRAAALDSLRGHLFFSARRKRLQLLAKPITRDGLRIAEGFGMSPTNPQRPGIGNLYCLTLDETAVAK